MTTDLTAVANTPNELTDEEIIALFKAHNPKTLDEIKSLGIPAVFVAKGVARATYRVSKNLLVKIEWCPAEKQSIKEIEVIRKIYRDVRYKTLRKHTPPLYYANKDTGIIVTKFYENTSPERDWEERCRIQNIFKEAVGVTDLHPGNFRCKKNGTHVVIDLGWN